MKYIAFFIMLLAGVPAMTSFALGSTKGRSLLTSILIASTSFGSYGKINFVSMESYRGPDRGFEMTLTDLICLALNLAIILKFGNKVRWIPPRIGLLALLFLIGVVSLFNAGVPLYGMFTLFKLVRMFCLYWCMVNVLETGIDVDTLWRGYILIGLIMTWLTLKQKYLNGMYRVTGPFDAPNSIPLYVNVSLAMLLTWAVSDRRFTMRQAALTLFCVLGMLFSVIATASRAGMFLGALTLLIALATATIRAPNARSVTVSVTFLALLIAGGIKTANSIANRVKEAPKSSEQARIEFNEAARAMLHDHPYGIGLNNFSWELTYHLEYRRYLVVMANEKEAGVCHHIYNLTAAELGWPGLVVYVTLILSFVWMAFRASRFNTSIECQLLFGMALGALALHLQGFLEWGLRITPVMQNFLMSCGIIAGLTRRVMKNRRLALRGSEAKNSSVGGMRTPRVVVAHTQAA